MATRIHPKNVHEKSPKNVHEMSPKKRTSRGQKCPRNVTKSVHEMSPFLSTRCHLLCPRDVCHPFDAEAAEKNLEWYLICMYYVSTYVYVGNFRAKVRSCVKKKFKDYLLPFIFSAYEIAFKIRISSSALNSKCSFDQK